MLYRFDTAVNSEVIVLVNGQTNILGLTIPEANFASMKEVYRGGANLKTNSS